MERITEDEKVCINLIKEFISKKFDNNCLEDGFFSLRNYPVGTLKNDEKYGDIAFIKELRGQRYFELDDTELVKAILFLFYTAKGLKIQLWKNRNNNYTSLYYKNFENQLTGDTINTFATLFSKKCEKSFETEKRIFPEFADNELKKDIEKFYEYYQYIGNFMLLPCKSINGRSLNTFRSGYYKNECDFNDYFHLFLGEIEKCLKILEAEQEATIERTKTFCNIIKQNEYYFDKCLRYNFKDFIDIHCLESYVCDILSKRANNICEKHYRCSEYKDDKDPDKQENYRRFAADYIKLAINNISIRSNVIILTVWERYRKYFNNIGE